MASPASPTDFQKLPLEIMKVGSVGTIVGVLVVLTTHSVVARLIGRFWSDRSRMPGAALSPAGAAAWPSVWESDVSGVLLVQAARTAPAPTTPPTARKRRRSRPADRRSVMKRSF